MRHLTLTIRDERVITKLTNLYCSFDEIKIVPQSESIVCRWDNIDALFASHVMQTVYRMPEVGSISLSEVTVL